MQCLCLWHLRWSWHVCIDFCKFSYFYMFSIAYFCIKNKFRLLTFLIIFLRHGIFLPSINLPRCKLRKCIFLLLHQPPIRHVSLVLTSWFLILVLNSCTSVQPKMCSKTRFPQKWSAFEVLQCDLYFKDLWCVSYSIP